MSVTQPITQLSYDNVIIPLIQRSGQDDWEGQSGRQREKDWRQVTLYLDPLTELVNQLLIAPTLAAFEEKVLAYLPKEREQK